MKYEDDLVNFVLFLYISCSFSLLFSFNCNYFWVSIQRLTLLFLEIMRFKTGKYEINLVFLLFLLKKIAIFACRNKKKVKYEYSNID